MSMSFWDDNNAGVSHSQGEYAEHFSCSIQLFLFLFFIFLLSILIGHVSPSCYIHFVVIFTRDEGYYLSTQLVTRNVMWSIEAVMTHMGIN